MDVMSKIAVLLATAAFTLAFVPQVFAQGVAPGGPIGNSTGIGSGLGGTLGTGPSYPNGTGQPTLQRPPPPGGTTSLPPPSAGPRLSTMRPSYPQPQAPFNATAEHPPAQVPLALPGTATGDVGVLKGCWRSDTFTYAGHTATTTWCFDGKATGRFLYSRIDQPTYFCHGAAEASLDDGALRLQALQPDCTDKAELKIGDLSCREGSDGASCNGQAEGGWSWKVRLYRVR
jgi:hypothetical protein